MSEQTITFFAEPFNYTFAYSEEYEEPWLLIEIVHHKSFLTWFVNINSEVLEKHDNSPILVEDLSPKMIFDIFSKYQNKSLKEDVKVMLPLNYKSDVDDIS